MRIHHGLTSIGTSLGKHEDEELNPADANLIIIHGVGKETLNADSPDHELISDRQEKTNY